MAEGSCADRFIATAFSEPTNPAEPIVDRLRIGFSWKAKVEYAFFYFAKWQGFYRAENLEATLSEGVGSHAVLDGLQRGDVDLVVLPSAFALSAIRDGLPLKIIALYQPSAPVCLVSHDDCAVLAPKDMEGKRIARLEGETGTAFLDRFCALNGVDYDCLRFVDIDRADKLDAFLRHDVDVISVYRTNELHILKSQPGHLFCELNIASFGMHLPGMCAVASDAFIKASPAVIDRFLIATHNATLAGWRDQSRLRAVARRIPGAIADEKIIAAQIDELISSILNDKQLPSIGCDPQILHEGLLALGQAAGDIPRDYFHVSKHFQEPAQ